MLASHFRLQHSHFVATPVLPIDPSDPVVRLAELFADHAPSVYFAGLAGAVFTAGVAWLLLRRIVKPGAPGGTLPPLQLVLRFGLGLLAVAGAGVVFAEIADELSDGEAMGRFDEALAAGLSRSLQLGELRAFAWVTHLGDAATLTALCVLVGVLLVLRGRRGMALAWVLACAGGGLLNRFLKATFERVRPVHDHGFAVADGFSFPSGHTAGAVVVYGMLAYLLLRQLAPRWHLTVAVATAALVFTIGFSRVMLQVHWASDVLAGFASGTAWLLTCVLMIEWLRRPARARGAIAAGR